jgi:hypothetical protein
MAVPVHLHLELVVVEALKLLEVLGEPLGISHHQVVKLEL